MWVCSGPPCKKVTTVYSSAHTINPWARLCVPPRHTALQVLLPFLKASTQADGGYCAAGRAERWKRTKWTDKASLGIMPVLLPAVGSDSLECCIDCLNYGWFEPEFCLERSWLMVTSSFISYAMIWKTQKGWMVPSEGVWIGSLEANIHASCYLSFSFSVGSRVITASMCFLWRIHSLTTQSDTLTCTWWCKSIKVNLRNVWSILFSF